MKKTFLSLSVSVIVILITVLTVFFVGISGLTSCLAAAEEQEPVTITWLASAQPNTTAAKALIPEFEKETGIKVVIDEMDEVRMLEKLALDKSAGTKLYDVMSIELTWIEKFIKDGIIYPIDDLIMDPSLPVPGLDLNDYDLAAIKAKTERYGKKWMVFLTSALKLL